MYQKLSAAIPSSPIRNILVVKLDHLGDMLWTTPALSALKFKYPQAAIHVVCMAGSEPILRHNPAVSKILVYDKNNFSSTQDKKKWLQASIGVPDLALCFDTRSEATLLTYLSDARIRAGYFYKNQLVRAFKSWLRLTHTFSHPILNENPEHEVIHNIRLLERLDLLSLQELPADMLRLHLDLSSDEKLQAQQVFQSLQLTNLPVIMYNIPNKTINKGWPKEHIITITEQLTKAFPGFRILLVAGPGEEPLLESIKASLPSACTTISGLPFHVWASLFLCCSFALSRDAGSVHVSAALGVPVISIFEYEWKHMELCFEPWQVPHINLIRPESPSPENIDRHVHEVVAAASSLWKKVSNAG